MAHAGAEGCQREREPGAAAPLCRASAVQALHVGEGLQGQLRRRRNCAAATAARPQVTRKPCRAQRASTWFVTHTWQHGSATGCAPAARCTTAWQLTIALHALTGGRGCRGRQPTAAAVGGNALTWQR